MIVTLTLNPSLDRSIDIPHLTRGAMIRSDSTRLDPGGKGINVARALLENGAKARAITPSGGPEGAQLAKLLSTSGIDVLSVPVGTATRSNVSLVEPDGTVTKINEAGGALQAAELDDIVEAVMCAAEGAEWVVACGSLPPGVAEDFYLRLCTLLAGTPIRVAVDTSGPPLRAALAGHPALIKPNRHELGDAVGRRLDSLGDVVDAAQTLRERGAGAVLASLGSAGAVLVDETGTTYGQSEVNQPRSSVGAGDAMLAGFLSAGAVGEPALRQALAWGAAAVGLPGSRMPGPADVAAARTTVRMVANPDRTTPLSETS